MGASDLLTRLRDSGLTITVDGDALRVSPKDALTDETRALIRAHKAELLDALGSAPDPAMEARRTKVLAMLNAGPNVRYAVAVTDPDSDPVLVAVGIRNTATFELEIPLACYDPGTLLELIEKHSLQIPVNPDTSIAWNGEIRT